MQKEVNYEDNLFFIISQIEQLQRMLELNLDGNLLHQKYILDINFFNDILAKIEYSIISNKKLINFLQYLQLIRKSRSALELLLITLHKSSKNLALMLKQNLNEHLEEMIHNQQECIHSLIIQLKQEENIEEVTKNESIGIEELQLLIGKDFNEEDQEE